MLIMQINCVKYLMRSIEYMYMVLVVKLVLIPNRKVVPKCVLGQMFSTKYSNLLHSAAASQHKAIVATFFTFQQNSEANPSRIRFGKHRKRVRNHCNTLSEWNLELKQEGKRKQTWNSLANPFCPSGFALGSKARAWSRNFLSPSEAMAAERELPSGTRLLHCERTDHTKPCFDEEVSLSTLRKVAESCAWPLANRKFNGDLSISGLHVGYRDRPCLLPRN